MARKEKDAFIEHIEWKISKLCVTELVVVLYTAVAYLRTVCACRLHVKR